MKRSKVIFIAILDWGLGHATRCVPIIQELIIKGYELHIGSNGNSLRWLQKQFPQLLFHELPSYNIHYSRKGSQALSVLMQFQKIRKAIAEEHKMISELAARFPFDAILSDNRYGCYLDHIPSVLLTHQLHLPGVPPLFKPIANHLLIAYLNKFDEVWIPDEALEPNLSGRLSHPALNTVHCQYIGLLSRFTNYNIVPKEFDVLAILSGPEPQRTILEEKIVAQLTSLKDVKSCVVRGTNMPHHFSNSAQISFVDLADSAALKSFIEKSEWVICRSGYSSLMDLQHSGKKLLLVPTPGQPEQEYLAQHFSKHQHVIIQTQSSLDIASAHNSNINHTNTSLEVNKQFKNVLNHWLNSV